MSENADIFTHKIPVNTFRVYQKSKFLFILYSKESHRPQDFNPFNKFSIKPYELLCYSSILKCTCILWDYLYIFFKKMGFTFIHASTFFF